MREIGVLRNFATAYATLEEGVETEGIGRSAPGADPSPPPYKEGEADEPGHDAQ